MQRVLPNTSGNVNRAGMVAELLGGNLETRRRRRIPSWHPYRRSTAQLVGPVPLSVSPALDATRHGLPRRRLAFGSGADEVKPRVAKRWAMVLGRVSSEGVSAQSRSVSWCCAQAFRLFGCCSRRRLLIIDLLRLR
jgi:hypothetical protein